MKSNRNYYTGMEHSEKTDSGSKCQSRSGPGTNHCERKAAADFQGRVGQVFEACKKVSFGLYIIKRKDIPLLV